MGAFVLLVILIALLALSFFFGHRRLDSPAVVFTFFFALATLDGLLNYERFAFDLHPNTVALVGGGAALFVAACLGLQRLAERRSKSADAGAADGEGTNDKTLGISKPVRVHAAFYVAGFALTCVAMFLMAREIISISTQNGGPADLFGAMGMYNELAKFGDVDVTFRGLTGNILVLADATYYLWAYVAAQNLCALKRKVNVPAFVLMFLLVVSSMLTGSRSELLMRGAAFLFMVLHFTYRRHAELKSDPTAKIALAVVIVLIVGFLGFQPLLKLTGRGASKLAPFEHISKYLGAPMKNLDMYLNDELRRPIKVESERWGEQTLAIAYVSIDHWTGQEPEIKWKDWQPFQKVKRVNLGNVYTIYYPFVFDWGYAGALVAITAMGAICEAVYLLSYTRRILWKGLIKTSVIVYGVMGYGLIFCFFHNFIVNAIVASGFVRMAAIWIVASVLAARVSKQDDAVAIEQ